MASKKYMVEAYNGRTVTASHHTNSLAQAEIYIEDFQAKYEAVILNRLRGIVQGVVVYDILKTYKGKDGEK